MIEVDAYKGNYADLCSAKKELICQILSILLDKLII